MDIKIDISVQQAIVSIHVLSVALWLGVIVALEFIGARVRSRKKAEEIVSFVSDYGSIATKVLLPSALIVMLSGGWLMQDMGLKFSKQWWLAAGFSLWLVAFLGSTLVRIFHIKHMRKLAGELGEGDEEVQWQARRVILLARGEMLLVTVALLLMVIKPS